jgi:hypothetical protein
MKPGRWSKANQYLKANQYEECPDHEESIDAGDCDAKTGASNCFVRAELWPAGE